MECVRLPLSALPPAQTSITYPDSFTAIGPGAWHGAAAHEPRPYHGRVVLLHELPGLVEQFGIPDPRWNGQHRAWTTWPADAYIEVQLWTDEPMGCQV